MSKRYIALVHRPAGTSSWGVTFPDFPGCTSAGETFEEAFVNAKDALSGHVAAMRADGEEVPEPSVYDGAIVDAVFAAEIAGGASPLMVEISDVPAPKERVNVMIDPGILRQLDRIAKEKGASRSLLIETAVAEFIIGDLDNAFDLLAKTVSGRQRQTRAAG